MGDIVGVVGVNGRSGGLQSTTLHLHVAAEWYSAECDKKCTLGDGTRHPRRFREGLPGGLRAHPTKSPRREPVG
mgnify:CR=1 FL=1